MTQTQRIVSGIQPTGNLHLGNYLGAIRNWVRMQDAMSGDSRCFFFLADLHAITVHQRSRAAARQRPRDGRRADRRRHRSARSVLFSQAQVPAHPELAWLLNGTARIGWLNRMTQFKEKSGKNREGASIGLYAYPVLQAADVLLYQATHVPVGEDQKQHLELARDIATKFNTDFAVDLFTLPEPIIPPAAARIMSLRDGTAKMSKSDPSDMSRINLVDDADTIAAEDPQGQDRSGAAARRSGRLGRPARGAQPGRDLSPRSPTRRRRRCWHDSPARASARSSRRWPNCWSRRSARSRRGSTRCAPIRPSSIGCWRRVPPARARPPRRRLRAPIARSVCAIDEAPSDPTLK